MADQWYYARNDHRQGPFSEAELRELAAKRELLPSDLVWKTGMPEWAKARTIPDLFSGAEQPPPLPSRKARPSCPQPTGQHHIARTVEQSLNGLSDRPMFSGDGPCPGCNSLLWFDWKLSCDVMECPGCKAQFTFENALETVFGHEPSKNQVGQNSFENFRQLIRHKKSAVSSGNKPSNQKSTTPAAYCDCPLCGNLVELESRIPEDIAGCHHCEVAFHIANGLNMRADREWVDQRGGLIGIAKMLVGKGGRRLSRREELERLLRLSNANYTLEILDGDTQAKILTQLQQQELRAELRAIYDRLGQV